MEWHPVGIPWAFPSEAFADGLQFLDARLIDFRINHPEFFHGLEDDVRNDQAGVFLVIGGNRIPGCVCRAGRVQACLVGFHVIVPALPLAHVREAELPVLVRLVDACHEALALLSFDRLRKNLMIRSPLRWRCASKSTMERYRPSQMACLAIEPPGSCWLRIVRNLSRLKKI